MAGGGGAWRRAVVRTRTLRALVRDTQAALSDVTDVIHIDPETHTTIHAIGQSAGRVPALVVLGVSGAARARLLRCLLGRDVLPEVPPKGCRWLCIQYGDSAAAQLTLSTSEFELVEELRCQRGDWDTIPVEDLIRQDIADLSTVLELELDNSFLKVGIRIIVPPDLDCDTTGKTYTQLKKENPEWYAKRDAILKNYNPYYLVAVDKITKNIFSEHFYCPNAGSKTEEDFLSMFHLYPMTNGSQEVKVEIEEERRFCESEIECASGDAVFGSESCLDLHQIKEINPNAQVMFLLFSDTEDSRTEREELQETTESTEERYKTEELPESDRDLMSEGKRDRRRLHEDQIAFMNELMDQWELMSRPPSKHQVKSQWQIIDADSIVRTPDEKTGHQNSTEKGPSIGKGNKNERDNDRVVRSRSSFLSQIMKFATDCHHSYMLEYSTKLSEVHVRLVQRLIVASLAAARELQLLPRKVSYGAEREQLLYKTIVEKFSEGDKKHELVQIMGEVLQEMRTEVDAMDWSVDDLPWHQDPRCIQTKSEFYKSSSQISLQKINHPINNSVCRTIDSNNMTTNSNNLTTYSNGLMTNSNNLTTNSTCRTTEATDLTDQHASDSEEAMSYESYNLDEFEVINSNDESLSCNDIFYSTGPSGPSSRRCAGGGPSAKSASLDVQHTVMEKLSRKISLKLVKFLDCLTDTYFGTLQRCVESLEQACSLSQPPPGTEGASSAVRALAAAARTVRVAPHPPHTVLTTLVDSLRRLLYKLRVVGASPPSACCRAAGAWRRRAARAALDGLTAQSLARVISTQIMERVHSAHGRFQTALGALAAALAERLHHTEDVKLAIRKKYAPLFARLCLESTSMCDLLMYGMPELGREIGRGQYGVVFVCRGRWRRRTAAVKSVLPHDTRHYHELAMEFFYTRSIPWHARIVPLLGSIVQRGGGVLLVSERKARDLHAALRAGLGLQQRMQVACDIVEGIRYLHSLGLVHRDIKMKNVLLDGQNRAALSDLGFCACAALVSGSVVGTPVHMAPELLSADYDAPVDVYAFGVLFWYVCANTVRLPSNFEQFQNKEQLWSRVKKGLRPERLPTFSDQCWEVMQSCWASEPSRRALLGDIQPKLEQILEDSRKESQEQVVVKKCVDSDGESLESCFDT